MSEIVQVSMRGARKEFFINSRSLWLRLRDKVIVQTETGEAIGSVFLRDPTLMLFLTQILESLDEFDFNLENSLTKGLTLCRPHPYTDK